MTNRIRQIEVRDGTLTPTQAEVWISVVPEHQTPTTEIRGRLMGPRCAYANTIEVAYPLRSPPSDLPPREASGILTRVVIPEPSFWEPESPFLYQGPVELWQDGLLGDRIDLSHGLRTLRLSKQSLLVNGRPLPLCGRSVTACSDEEARKLHQAGTNLLVAPVTDETMQLWERADRLGFFMLGRLPADNALSASPWDSLRRHPSIFGWLIEAGKRPSAHEQLGDGLLGGFGDVVNFRDVADSVAFLFGGPELANIGKPLLVLGEVPAHLQARCLVLGNVL